MSVERSLTAPDGRRRSYLLHVPGELPPGRRPLVVALHGGGESAARFEAVTRLSAHADRDGWVVAYPQGTGEPDPARPGRTRRRSWNAGRCCGPARRDAVDDVGFVSALIADVATLVPVDPDAVHLVGHSNGGMLAYRLALELPGRIAAVGVHSASLAVDPVDGSAEVADAGPPMGVSVIDVHGGADRHHPLDGGRGPDSRAETPYEPVPGTCAVFARAAGCGPPSERRDGEVTVTAWRAPTGAEVRLVVVDRGTHAWMGGAPTGSPGVGGAGYPGFDATGAIWAFLRDHPRRRVVT